MELPQALPELPHPSFEPTICAPGLPARTTISMSSETQGSVGNPSAPRADSAHTDPVTAAPLPTLAPTPIPVAVSPAPAPAPGLTMPAQASPHGAPVRQYLNSKVTPTLLEGMKTIAKEQ